MNYSEVISQLPMGKRFLGLFMILLFGTAVALGTAYLKHNDCSTMVERCNELIESQSIKDRQCEADKQMMLATQAKMQEIYADMIQLKRMVKKSKPDTVMISAKYAVVTETRNGETIPTIKPAQPVLKKDKEKEAMLNKIEEIQATIKE